MSAGIAFEDRPLKAQLKMADKADAEFVAIIGDAELAAGTVTLRRLADGTQTSVSSGDLVRRLTPLPRLDGSEEGASKP